jgi:hypothetical protein
MDAQSQEPEALPSQADQAARVVNESIGWANIFYGLIIAPVTTLNVLANPRIYRVDRQGVMGVLALVVLCGLIESFAQAALDRQQPLANCVLAAFANDCLTWLILSAILLAWAALLKTETSFRTALIVTGWAYVPLIFKAPIVCFGLAATGFAQILLVLPVLWFFILELIAFDAVLKLGKVKTFGIVILLPPMLIIACLFWCLFWAITAVGQ